MILRPAWKLLNQTLPVFTEVVGYGQKPADSEDSEKEDAEDSWDDNDVDPDEMEGVEGMIF
jgi:hypothetical protein